MSKEELKELIEMRDELDFEYNGKEYSITYYYDDREDYIAFCEYYKEPVTVGSVDELCELKIDGEKLIDIIKKI